MWFFGSSALFGPSIIRDDHTIPSEIVRLAEADGVSIRASNFGVPGFMTWQEGTLLAKMLSERPDPDLVVIYGGYNDLHFFTPPGAPTEISSIFADDMRQALQDANASVQADPTLDPTPRTAGWSPHNAATIYDRSVDYIDGILDDRDIPYTNFLQPALWTRDRPEDDATLASIGADREYLESYGAVYNAARADITAPIVDLSDVLDDVPGVVFWDNVHHNELADRVIAEAMYAELTPQITDLWAASDEP